MKEKILALLRQSNDDISGQNLCEQLNVSRTAVWKAVNALKAEGYQIEAVQNRGYRLTGVPDVLTKEEIMSHLHTRWAGCQVEAHEKITYSTNQRVKQLADQGAPEGTLVVADVQEGGKGRRGRAWVAPVPGTNIAMSFLLRPEIDPSRASMMTLIAAMAVRAAIADVTGMDTKIKWPNDVIVNKKKVCGILTEMTMEEEYIQSVVVGIGINVHNESFPEELKEKATSLLIETGGGHFSRAEITAKVLEHFEEYYEKFIADGDLRRLQEEYNSCLTAIGGKVSILAPEKTWEGISRGINEEGALLVEKEDGSIEKITSGEVSVRGIYGYV